MNETVATSTDVANIREDLRRHEDQDREDFADVRKSLTALTSSMSEWSGALKLAKWVLGLGVPAILAALITDIVRHW